MSERPRIVEGVGGVWHYHLAIGESSATALCGAKTMSTAIPLDGWGFVGHLNEKYCAKCAELGGLK